MKINEFRNQYDLHDSLLERLTLDNNILELEIELCNWRQRGYTSEQPEMRFVKLIFNNIQDYLFDATNFEINSDTILDFECDKITSNLQTIKIVTEGNNDIKIIKFKSNYVDIFL